MNRRYTFKDASRSEFIKSFMNYDELDDILDNFRNLIDSLDRAFQYNIVFVGPVGVGKSTICTMLYFLLDRAFGNFDADVYCYPEFLRIEPEVGHTVLRKHINGEMSSFEFQRYILSCWDTLMTTQPLSRDNNARRFNVFERCCDDSVICFSNIWNQRTPDKLNDFQFIQLYEESQKLNKRHNIPTYFRDDYITLAFDVIQTKSLYEMLTDLISIISRHIANGKTTMFIMIDADLDTLSDRILSRARPGENGYSHQNIEDFYMHYQLLHKYITEYGRLRSFQDIKCLI